jgi:hypothetical protein
MYNKVANLELHFAINFLVSIFFNSNFNTYNLAPDLRQGKFVCGAYGLSMPLVWNSELSWNIIMNCEQGSIYRG